MKKIILTSGLFVILSCISINAQQQDSTQVQKIDPKAAKYWNRSVEALKLDKMDEAILMLDSALIYQKDIKFYYQKGVVLKKAGKNAEAKQALLATIEHDKQYEPAYKLIASINLSEKDYDGAIEYYNKLLAFSKDPQTITDAKESIEYCVNTKALQFFNAGNDQAKAGKFDEAVLSYDKSLEIKKDFKTYFQKGLTLMKAQKMEESKTALLACVAVNDSFYNAHVALAGLYTTLKDYESAVKSYEKAITLVKDEKVLAGIKEGLSKAYVAQGGASMKDKKYDKAIESYKKANEAAPFDQAFLGLGKALTEKKQYDAAIEAFDKALEIKKTVTEGAIAYYKAVIYKAKGDKVKALEAFKLGATDPVYKKACDSEIARMKAEGEKKK